MTASAARRPRSMSTRLAEASKKGDIAAIARTVAKARLDGIELNTVNYTAVANAYVMKADTNSLRFVLSEMRSKSVRPSNVTLRVMAKAKLSPKELFEILEWFYTDGDEPGDCRTWNIMLKAIVRRKGKESATFGARAFELMRRHGVPGGAAPLPDVCTYNTLLEAYRGRGYLRKGLDLFARLRVDKNVIPDTVTYNTLLCLCLQSARSSDKKTHMLAIHTLVAILRSMSDAFARYHLQCTVRLATIMLYLVTEWHEAPLLGECVLEDYEVSLRKKNNNRARRLIEHIRDESGQNGDLRFCNALISAYQRIGDSKGALSATQDTIDQHHLQPDLYTMNSLIAVAALNGDIDLAQRLMKKIQANPRWPLNAVSYTALLSACWSDVEVADRILEDAISNGVECTPAMLNASLICQGQDITSALERWRGWQKHAAYGSAARHLDVYRGLLRVAGLSGRPDMALRIVFAGTKAGALKPDVDEGLFKAFRRGLREGGHETEVMNNLISRQYVAHLRLQCRVFETGKESRKMERLRIRW